ncbi:ragulator complex protein LAMTOR3-like isoform X1 [Varroa jacobsoni]|uniref:Roadblock/LAMTOR2 domain-containing protein n=2 Tax=Varroa TaxID=62624 RepID=A0A7M7KJX7_VARDE|nr:ragulator complex protein LAMTOR3-like [Varroa destructor]XP_022709309.1 ragulator complex protein LAMTOR3-like isoform X1 [Varroa jacobsoni]
MGFEDVREQLQQLMQRVDGLNAIVFSDRDGVPVVKVCRIGQDAFGNQIKSEALSSSVSAMTQAARLGMGNVKRMVVCKESNQLVCFNMKQVCVQLFASSAATTGMLLCLENELSSLAEDLARVIETS